jgi:hypothetical protein
MEDKLEIMKSDKTNPSSSRNVAIEKNSAQRNSNAREQTRQDVLVYVGSEKYNAYHAKTKRESSSSSNDIVSMDVFSRAVQRQNSYLGLFLGSVIIVMMIKGVDLSQIVGGWTPN